MPFDCVHKHVTRVPLVLRAVFEDCQKGGIVASHLMLDLMVEKLVPITSFCFFECLSQPLLLRSLSVPFGIPLFQDLDKLFLLWLCTPENASRHVRPVARPLLKVVL